MAARISGRMIALGEIDTSSTAVRATDAFARTAALVPEAVSPPRPAGAVRPRFDVAGQGASADAAVRATPRPPDADGRPDDLSSAGAAGRRSRGGLIGALTSFVAKVLGQGGDGDAATPSAMLAGMRAYARAAGQPQSPPTETMDVLSPSLPRLSSGRVLDLSV